MELPDTQTIIGLLLGILPGFIVRSVRSQIGSHDTGATELNQQMLGYIVATIIYWSLVLALGLAALPELFDLPSISQWVLLYIIIGPSLVGFVGGITLRFQLVRRILQLVKLNPRHSIPSAWDRKFAEMSEQWVVITLVDGVMFCGRFTVDSYASSNPAERDIYVATLCELTDEGQFGDILPGKSLWVSQRDIRTIEFISTQAEIEADDDGQEVKDHDQAAEHDNAAVAGNREEKLEPQTAH